VVEFESTYVREGVRGMRVGAKLAGGLLASAEVRGALRGSVTAFASNEHALRFYERRGFQPKSLTLGIGPP
jgi:GNAT superfamily N-acetyltransferase